MKLPYALPFFILLATLYSFTSNKACDYAGSNVGYIKTQTRKALGAKDVNTSRFYAYRALNAIEKSKEQFEACDCEYAMKNINESLDNLKKATRVTSLNGTKILLNRALENALGSLEALAEHDELHGSKYASDMLAINTTTSEKEKLSLKLPVGKALERKIDLALVNYQNSLNDVVNTVDCKEAYAFAVKNYERCEQELLKPELTEAKKYYNLKTKEITENALKQLRACID